MKYAQKEGKRGLFLNVTTVLPASDRVGHPTETFLGSAELSFDPSMGSNRAKCQDRRIIQGTCIFMITCEG